MFITTYQLEHRLTSLLLPLYRTRDDAKRILDIPSIYIYPLLIVFLLTIFLIDHNMWDFTRNMQVVEGSDFLEWWD